MKTINQFFLLFILLLVFGCGISVPEDKLDYVGEWKSGTMYLSIKQDGSVNYKRIKGSATTTVSAPLKRFVGDNFEVGIGMFTTTFVVNKPPFKAATQWTMTVDGIELVKSNT